MDIKQKIESILLFKGQPATFKELAKTLDTDDRSVKELVTELSEEYRTKGYRIVFDLNECELVTAPESSELLRTFQKNEKETDLSNAGLETLSIVLYMGPIARSMIDFVRGVNSQFTVRALLTRGLIQKTPNEKTPKYNVTLDTIKFLGLNSIDQLPNYLEVRKSISNFIKENSSDDK